MSLGLVIKKLRQSKGFSQKEFAMACKVTPGYLSQVENDKRRPGHELLNTIGELFEVPPQVLTFLSISEKDVKPEKRDVFLRMEKHIKNIVEDIFLDS